MGRAGEHDEVTVEATLEDEACPGYVWPERDDDDRPPPVLRRQTAQFCTMSRVPWNFGGGMVSIRLRHLIIVHETRIDAEIDRA